LRQNLTAIQQEVDRKADTINSSSTAVVLAAVDVEAGAEKRISQSLSAGKIEVRLDSLNEKYLYSPTENSAHTSKSSMIRHIPPPVVTEKDEPFDTYVSTKSSIKSCADETRDDTDCFSHLTDVDTAMALGELSEEQRLALEQLDLSGSKEDISAMLKRVPGLTNNQVNLLVDVASSLTI